MPLLLLCVWTCSDHAVTPLLPAKRLVTARDRATWLRAEQAAGKTKTEGDHL
jgi:hypothetical protein